MYAIRAIYRNGSIELLDTPPSKRDSRVLVIFPDRDDSESLGDELRFVGTSEMNEILKSEPAWKPDEFIERRE
jgi:hypothetical protein